MKTTRQIHFTKMHALGNDFMLIDALEQRIDPACLPVRQWADRHTGIGFDQLLLILPSQKATVSCRIFNSDGTEAEQCGNGMRCVARYLHESGQAKGDSLTIETRGGLVEAHLHSKDRIEVSLGIPLLQPGWLDLNLPGSALSFRVFSLSIGNPHAILLVESLSQFPIGMIGQQISTHEKFPGGVNVGFVEHRDHNTIVLRTFERGAGETLACGSNACAAAVAGIWQRTLVSPVTVQLARGSLQVTWENTGRPVYLLGEAVVNYEGHLYISRS